MANVPLFLQRLSAEQRTAAESIATVIDHKLNSVADGVFCRISLDEITKGLEPGLSSIVAQEIDGTVVCVKFHLKPPLDRFHSAWIARAIHEAEYSFQCVVGVKREDIYTTTIQQFDALPEEMRLAAAGVAPEAALEFVLENEKAYDPGHFDSDGFRIAG
jgi:hypothetical protein